MARGKCCYFFIPTGREKRTEFAKKEGRFFKFVETGEVDAPVFTRVENPGIMGEKHGRGWARMDQTQRALLSTLYERWYGVLHRYAQWAVGDALLAEEIVQETFLAAVPKIEELAAGEHPERQNTRRSMSCGSRPGSGPRTRCWRNPWLHPISWGSGRTGSTRGSSGKRRRRFCPRRRWRCFGWWHWKSWGTRRRQSDWGSRCGPARNECSVFEKSCGPRGESWKGGHHEATGGDHAGIVPGGIGADASE